jgi:hypothetical protein
MERYFPTLGHRISFVLAMLAGLISAWFGNGDLASGIFFGAGIVWIGVA